MSQTISKHIGEGFGKGELYAALAYDETDQFGGVRIKGLYIAAPTTAVTALSGLRLQSDFSGNGYHFGAYFESKYTLAGASYGTVRALVGVGDLSAVQTDVGSAQYIVGVHGRAKVSGTAYNSSLFVTGVHGQILDGGTYTKSGHVSAIWADSHLNKTVSAGEYELIYMTHNTTNGTTMTSGIYAYLPYVTNLLKLYGGTVGGMVSAASASALHGTLSKKIKINIDGTTYYLLASTNPT